MIIINRRKLLIVKSCFEHSPTFEPFWRFDYGKKQFTCERNSFRLNSPQKRENQAMKIFWEIRHLFGFKMKCFFQKGIIFLKILVRKTELICFFKSFILFSKNSKIENLLNQIFSFSFGECYITNTFLTQIGEAFDMIIC